MPTTNRRPKLTPELKEKLLDLLRQGNYYEPTCTALGIDPQSLRAWLLKGSVETSGIYYELFRDVRQAEGEAEVLLVKKLQLAGDRDWRANLEFLSRRWPNRWALKVEQQSEVRVQHEHLLTTIVAIPEIAERVAEAFRLGVERRSISSPSEE